MKVYDKLYINSAWVAPAGKGTIDSACASTEEVVTRIPEGSKEGADRAVAAAITPWSMR
jgi:acyl-CoA reductase-like NAD-dependent aldehyde dehydrogenase